MSFEALFKGYPYDGIKSKEIFPNRPTIDLKDGKVGIVVPLEFYAANWTEEEAKPNNFTDFLLHRLHDYSCALKIAETQISDLCAAYPFLPQDFGFFPKEIPDGKGGNIRVYEADGIGLMRDNATDKENMWWLVQPGKSNIQLWLPTNHIAFAVLKSLCIYNPKLDDEAVVADVSMSKEEQDEINRKAKEHDWSAETSENQSTRSCKKCGIQMNGPVHWSDEFMMRENSIDPVCGNHKTETDESGEAEK